MEPFHVTARRTQVELMQAMRKAARRPDLSEIAQGFVQSVGPFIGHAECFAWSAETARLVWEASDAVPDDAFLPADMPEDAECALWLFESPLPFPLRDERGRAFRLDEDAGVDVDHMAGLLFARMSDTNEIMFMDLRRFREDEVRRLTAEGKAPLFPCVTNISGFIPIGMPLSQVSLATLMGGPMEFDEREGFWARLLRPFVIRMAKFYLAASFHLSQRVALETTSTLHIERHVRKQFLRDAGVDDLPALHVITLRKGIGTGDGERPLPTFHCRWLVREHKRLITGKDGQPRKVFVRAHIKGPEGMPFRPPRPRVFAVTR